MSCSCDGALQGRPFATENNLCTWAAAFRWNLDFRFSNVDLIGMRTEVVPCKKIRAGVGWQSQQLMKIKHHVVCQRTPECSIVSNSHTDISVFLSSRL